MSYSRNRRLRRDSGIYIGPTRGLSSPKNSKRGCLCIHSNTYSTKCCGGALIEQGIGQITYPRTEQGSFSSAFSNDFDI